MGGSGSGGDKVFGRFTEPAHQVLVSKVRRGGHVVHPVDNLVPHPIVWEQQEVGVREPPIPSRHLFHGVLPPHPRIIPSSASEDDANGGPL